jgi:hypothetical protein
MLVSGRDYRQMALGLKKVPRKINLCRCCDLSNSDAKDARLVPVPASKDGIDRVLT